jgi:hypothetical protein
MAKDSQGRKHFAAVWDEPEHRVNYLPPGGSWVAVDKNSRARSQADIDITDDIITITYTNDKGQVCCYEGPVGTTPDGWSDYGPNGGKVM